MAGTTWIPYRRALSLGCFMQIHCWRLVIQRCYHTGLFNAIRYHFLFLWRDVFWIFIWSIIFLTFLVSSFTFLYTNNFFLWIFLRITLHRNKTPGNWIWTHHLLLTAAGVFKNWPFCFSVRFIQVNLIKNCNNLW